MLNIVRYNEASMEDLTDNYSQLILVNSQWEDYPGT